MSSSIETLPSVEVSRTKIVTPPPFPELILYAHRLGEDEWQNVLLESHRFDSPYFSWQTVRKHGVEKLGCTHTGFDGYFIGQANTGEELARQVIAIGCNIWANIRRLHRHAHLTRNRLEAVILGTKPCQAKDAQEFNQIFGAELARKRALLRGNPQAQAFQAQNKQKTNILPYIEYHLKEEAGEITQVYWLPPKPKAVFTPCTVCKSDEERLAFQTVQEIGKFGHPLIRASLRYLN